MKKLFLFLLLAFDLTSVSYADYLDDWPDEALCSWMENPSPPSYMVEEVKTRSISCSGGVVTNDLPDTLDNKTILDNVEISEEVWLEKYDLIPDDLGHMVKANGSSMIAIYDVYGNLLNRSELIQELIAINPYFEPPAYIDPGIEYAPETLPGADPKIVPDLPPVVDKPPSDPNPPPKNYEPPPQPDPPDPNPPPKIDPGIEYAPETLPGADPKIVPDLPPVVDKPPSDPNPPPIIDDPSVLQPVDPG